MEAKIKIVFVEDEAVDLELIQRALRKSNIVFDADVVDTAEAYWHAIGTFPDLILADYKLPRFDGMEALRLRQELCPTVPFILITGTNNEEIAVGCMKAGADDYILKDNLTRLGEAVKGAIGKQAEVKARIVAQQALRESEEMFRTAFESAAMGVCMLDDNLRFTNVNPTFCQMLGYTKDELLAMAVVDITYADDLAVGMGYYHRLAQGIIGHASYEKRYVHQSGKVLWCNITVGTVHDRTTGRVGYVAYVQDVSERKETERLLLVAKEKAEESEKLKTAFLNNVSHEIRTPMNSIVGFSEFLKRPNLDQEKRNYFVDLIGKSSYQLLSIINEIVEVSELEAKQVHLKDTRFCLNSALVLLYQQYSKHAEKQGLGFEYEFALPDQDAIFLMDEQKLRRIMGNLLANAIKFTPKGKIEFGYKMSPRLQLYVKDTGIGVPSSLYGAIFEHFRQGDGTTERHLGGTGLGLSIAKAYVELMGGRIWLESRLGIGSTFFVEFPVGSNIVADAVSNIKEAVPVGAVGEGYTVLVAEDEELNYLLIEEILLGLKVNVLKAVDGVEAVKVANSQHVDLVLMDMKLPRMDGFVATKVIKSMQPNLPIIALTAYVGERERTKAMESGCSDFISKPVDYDVIVGKVLSALRLK